MMDKRKTLIIGNGLGMALDSDYFSLDKAIQDTWNNEDTLNEDTKKLITNCLPDSSKKLPQGEDDLENLQLALSSCDLLNELGTSDIHWLSQYGQNFPNAVRKFIFHTASYFHKFEETLPDTFTEPFVKFIKDTKSHVATLNYDNLLYQPLIDSKILYGYNGELVDGFPDSGFELENLDRKYSKTFGYYLHLHGTPLFINENQKIKKLSQSNLVDIDENSISSHIVLTHFKHKESVINNSYVLKSYWHKLYKAFNESIEIILFGYSGLDLHLNNIIKDLNEQIVIKIIEWDGSGSEEDRNKFWSELFDKDIELIHMSNILEFNDW